jgi:uncharacterized phage protein (TIGR02220 family)
MALRNQPYMKIYPKDWQSDEKLKECNAESHGVMFNIMCLMHQSYEYGVILLKQKYKQSNKQILNFAKQLAKQLPFEIAEIERGITELVDEGVLQLDEDRLVQKRMVKDANLSDIRASAGSIGGSKGKSFANDFATAKSTANYDYEYVHDNENENESVNVTEDKKERIYVVREIIECLNIAAGTSYRPSTKATQRHIGARLNEGFTLENFKTVIAKKAAEWKGTDMAQYLRPETLFGTKFESYLNQPIRPTMTNKSGNVFADIATEEGYFHDDDE